MALAGALLVMLIAAGCGGSDDGGATNPGTEAAKAPKAAPGQTVSQAEIDRYGPGEPEHTVLAWWHLAQVNDPETAQPLYAEEPTLPNLAGQFNYVSADLAGTVKVVSTKVNGDTAKVKVKWKRPGGGSTEKTVALEKVGPDWKLGQVRFVDVLVKEKQEAEEG